MRSKFITRVKAQSHGRLLGFQGFVFFPYASLIVAYFPVLEWQVLGLQETSPPDTCIIPRWRPWFKRPNDGVGVGAELKTASLITPP